MFAVFPATVPVAGGPATQSAPVEQVQPVEADREALLEVVLAELLEGSVVQPVAAVLPVG